MKLAGKTDVGSVRPENQDDYRAGELNSDAAWGLVCDGMGGARGGREASMSACDVIEHSFHEQYAQCLPGDEEKFLKRALTNANRFVFQKASREEELAGMGTTAVCALVRGVNDSDACAKQLADLIRGMGAHVNLIPINPVDGSPYSATDAANVRRFQQKLESLGVNATVRRRLGSEISAACGQLRRDEMNGKA